MQVGWNSKQPGYDEITTAVEEAKAAGIFIICSSIERVYGFKFNGLGRDPLADPDTFESYEPWLLTGKTKSGISIGVIDRVTARENAQISYLGQRREQAIEPLLGISGIPHGR